MDRLATHPQASAGKVLDITQLGNPVLRQTAQFVPEVGHPQIQSLIDDLLVTVKQANGVGLAAPQVGASWQIFIVASHPNPRYPHAPEMEPTAMINPRLLAHNDRQVKDWEGCLSIPGLRGLVPRYQGIEVEYLDRSGKTRRQQFEGFVARIFQHEQDHLEGVVFLDRLETTLELVTEQEYQKLIAEA